MKKYLFASVIVFVSVYAYALRVQPGSQASGDSESTAETLVYRDASANFSAGTITATLVGAVSGGTVTPSLLVLPTATTAQLVLRSDAVGSTFLVQEYVAGALVSNSYNLCTSTAANIASYVYIAVSTGSAAAQLKNGQACAF